MAKKCAYCGEYSGIYELCKACYHLSENGDIDYCDECEKWFDITEGCDCEPEDNSRCILCQETANGYFFCKECYSKYWNKTLFLKTKDCRTFELLEASYEGRYTCADGHIVKSKSERDIDNYLYYHNIRHAYEKALPIDEKVEHDLHPDFYLPDIDVYIEHWGYDEDNEEYSEIKDYKLKIYKEKKITLICTDEQKDAGNIDATLERKLKSYKKNEIN